jgi:hypothetical protein
MLAQKEGIMGNSLPRWVVEPVREDVIWITMRIGRVARAWMMRSRSILGKV